MDVGLRSLAINFGASREEASTRASFIVFILSGVPLIPPAVRPEIINSFYKSPQVIFVGDRTTKGCSMYGFIQDLDGTVYSNIAI